ncbi:MAG: hypothetical protein ACFN04_09780 [Propionibacterium acidifaciens]
MLAAVCLCGCAAAPATSTPASSTAATPSGAWPDATGASLPEGCDTGGLGSPDGDEAGIRAAVEAAEVSGAAVRMSWYAPDGGIRTAGALEDLPAWSTSKIPLALAVIDSGQGEAQTDSIALALEESDNSAADALWTSLGGTDAERADAVTQVLRRAGDGTTTVPTEQLAAGFSIFGQTQWTTDAQVGFLSQLPCLGGADEVIADMGRVDPAQAWGIGSRPGAVHKSGWGPSPAGGLHGAPARLVHERGGPAGARRHGGPGRRRLRGGHGRARPAGRLPRVGPARAVRTIGVRAIGSRPARRPVGGPVGEGSRPPVTSPPATAPRHPPLSSRADRRQPRM